MDDEEIKVNFSRPMLVLKIRDVYKAPYHKNKYVILRKKDCESVIAFKKKLHEYTGNWSSGLYDLQFVIKEGTYLQPTIYSTLVRIEIRNGKVSKVWKVSPYAKRDYPIWKLFVKKKRRRKKLKRKKLIKNMTVKEIKKGAKKKLRKEKNVKKRTPKKKGIKRKKH